MHRRMGLLNKNEYGKLLSAAHQKYKLCFVSLPSSPFFVGRKEVAHRHITFSLFTEEK
jgi:hypothetical protein